MNAETVMAILEYVLESLGTIQEVIKQVKTDPTKIDLNAILVRQSEQIERLKKELEK